MFVGLKTRQPLTCSLNWRGKGKDEPKTAMADAKRQGKAMMLFFTSEG